MVFGLNFRSWFPIVMLCTFVLAGCADVNVPGARSVDIPGPNQANKRTSGINERPDSVIYLPLGSDVLVPEVGGGTPLPDTIVGPFELRSETLAGALQLILADYEIPLAFETEEGLTRTVTVTNLRGPLRRVVEKTCGLADLYCSFEGGILVIKEYQTFTVTIPPIGDGDDVLGALASGVEALTGRSPITESVTRSIIYEATQRTSRNVERYFQRLRANTALIVYEVYIWEVSLDSANSTGINWTEIEDFGVFQTGFSLAGTVSSTVSSNPISIGLPTKGNLDITTDDVFKFISTFGAVKTVSQPQITMLSGGAATLRVADTINYVSSLSQSVDNGEVTVSTETDSVDTGFTLTVASSWDNATIYGSVELSLQEFQKFDEFSVIGGNGQPGTGTSLLLPVTSETELTTQTRIRPGDSLLMAGLVTAKDNFNEDGPGFSAPFFPSSRAAIVSNSELVIMMRPRVVVYTSENPKNIANSTFSSVINPSLPQSPVSGSRHSVLPGLPATEENLFPAGTITNDMLNPGL